MKASCRRFSASALASALALTLAACDDSSPAPTPSPTPTPPPNAAPAFTSAATALVAENVLAAYTATATDANNDPLTFSISGGADAPLFQITTAGALTFRAAPDFELPRDADRNNVYSVEVTVSDGKDSTKLLVAVTVTDVATGGYTIRKVAEGFSSPNGLTPIPGDAARLFVTEKGGRVRIMNRSTGVIATQPFLDVSAEVSTDIERGLLGFAPAPDFATSGAVYVSLTNRAGELEIRRYTTMAGDRDRANPASANLILKVPAGDPIFASGWLGFGPDGLLYITTGAGWDPDSDINTLTGKVLRIDVSRDDFPADTARDYAIPASNPDTSGRDEIFVRGFRAPRRATIDGATGIMFVSDYSKGVEMQHFFADEISMVRPEDAGLDYRYFNERRCVPYDPVPGMIVPIYCRAYGLVVPEDTYSIMVGPVYRGPVEAFQGRLFAGQQYRPEIITLQNILEIQQYTYATSRIEPVTPPIGAVNAFGEDAVGNLYFVQGNGEIYVLEPS